MQNIRFKLNMQESKCAIQVRITCNTFARLQCVQKGAPMMPAFAIPDDCLFKTSQSNVSFFQGPFYIHHFCNMLLCDQSPSLTLVIPWVTDRVTMATVKWATYFENGTLKSPVSHCAMGTVSKVPHPNENQLQNVELDAAHSRHYPYESETRSYM